MIPQTYEQWHHCITVECGITLTLAYVLERVAVWNDGNAEETLRFRRIYGDRHWKAVQGWFIRAARELGA